MRSSDRQRFLVVKMCRKWTLQQNKIVETGFSKNIFLFIHSKTYQPVQSPKTLRLGTKKKDTTEKKKNGYSIDLIYWIIRRTYTLIIFLHFTFNVFSFRLKQSTISQVANILNCLIFPKVKPTKTIDNLLCLKHPK